MVDFESVDENLRATLRTFALAKERGENCELDGVAVSCSGVYFAMFNTALLTSPVGSVQDLETRLVLTAQHFEARGLPWSFWLCDDWMSPRIRLESKHVFFRLGLRLVVDLPGMAAEGLHGETRPLPELEIRQVGDEESRFAFNHIMSATFGIPLSLSGEIYRSERMWNGAFTGYLGYADGNPVATVATMLAGGVVGVYAVATLPAHQRRGCAEVMLRGALELARKRSGITATVLESSVAGFGLYDRIGYKTVTHYTVYAFN